MPIEVKAEAARQGAEIGTMRYVLAMSLSFAVMAMTALFILS